MKVSVVITVFNASSTIVETLESVFGQTYKDIEVVVVDDGSTDDSVLKIREFMEGVDADKISLYEIERTGRAGALKIAVNHCRYDWLAIVDADDLWHSRKLEYQCRFISEGVAEIVATSAKMFTNSNPTIELIDGPLEYSNKAQEIGMKAMLVGNHVCHSSVVMKKKYAKYNEQLQSQVDYELWLRIVDQGVSIYRLESALTFRRLHSKQFFSYRRRFRSRFKYALNSIHVMRDYAVSHGFYHILFYQYVKLGYQLMPRPVHILKQQVVKMLGVGVS